MSKNEPTIQDTAKMCVKLNQGIWQGINELRSEDIVHTDFDGDFRAEDVRLMLIGAAFVIFKLRSCLPADNSEYEQNRAAHARDYVDAQISECGVADWAVRSCISSLADYRVDE